MSFNALPHEVVEQIIDSISDSPRQYREYSLVSRRWLLRCRYYAFRHIGLRAPSSTKLLQSMMRGISPFVRELTITLIPTYEGDYKRSPHWESWESIALLNNLERVTIAARGCMYSVEALPHLFHHLLPAVKGNKPVIEISEAGTITYSDFRKNVAPLLREASELYLSGSFDIVDEPEADLPASSIQAGHLTLKAKLYKELDLVAQIVHVGPCHLQSLIINHMNTLWQDVLRKLGPSLKYFIKLYKGTSLSLREHNTASMIPDLSANTNLRTIGYDAPQSEPLRYSSRSQYLMQMVSTIAPTLEFALHIGVERSFSDWTTFKSTIEQIAVTHPSASFILHSPLDQRRSDLSRFGVFLQKQKRFASLARPAADPEHYSKYFLTKLYETGRLAHDPKDLDKYVYSDLR